MKKRQQYMYQGESPSHHYWEGKTHCAHSQVLSAEKLDIEIVITGQINIAVNWEYFPQRFQVVIADNRNPRTCASLNWPISYFE